MSQGVIIFFAVAAAGYLGSRLGIPGGPMMFGLLAGLIIKALMQWGLDPKIGWLSWVSQALVAYVLVRGSDFSSLREMVAYFPAAVSYSILLFIFTLGMAWAYSKVFGMSLLTSLFATSPGGLSGISVVAIDMGADANISVLFNMCRIVVILVVVPILANVITKYWP
jgi:membrane AbrB-like protein